MSSWMPEIELIEAPSNLGLKEPAPGHEPGVRYLPEALLNAGLLEGYPLKQKHYVPAPDYSMQLDAETGIRNADKIAAYSIELAAMVKEVITRGRFPLVLGGDCSILAGPMIALKQMGQYGLFFLDGHTDFIWPEMSATAGAAGMDLAIVTGNSHPKLSDIRALGPYVQEKHVMACGNREYDEDYVSVIRNSEVNYIDLNRMRQTAVKTVADDFLGLVDRYHLDGFWLHVDVDVLDPVLMPAVDSPDPGGLSYEEFTGIIRLLLNSGKAAGMEITIFDPELDEEGRYAKALCKALRKAFSGSLFKMDE